MVPSAPLNSGETESLHRRQLPAFPSRDGLSGQVGANGDRTASRKPAIFGIVGTFRVK